MTSRKLCILLGTFSSRVHVTIVTIAGRDWLTGRWSVILSDGLLMGWQGGSLMGLIVMRLVVLHRRRCARLIVQRL